MGVTQIQQTDACKRLNYSKRDAVYLLVSDLLRNSIRESSNTNTKTSISASEASQSQTIQTKRNSVSEMKVVRVCVTL